MIDHFYTLLSALTLGGYVFTGWVYRSLRARLDELLANHIKHLEERVRELENGRE